MARTYVEGDKVIPIKKSVYGTLDQSTVWKMAQKNGQGFLYYCGIDREDGYYMLSNEQGGSRDYFAAGDFIHYEADEEEGVFPYITSIKELNQLVKQGLLKEDDEFLVRRA